MWPQNRSNSGLRLTNVPILSPFDHWKIRNVRRINLLKPDTFTLISTQYNVTVEEKKNENVPGHKKYKIVT